MADKKEETGRDEVITKSVVIRLHEIIEIDSPDNTIKSLEAD